MINRSLIKDIQKMQADVKAGRYFKRFEFNRTKPPPATFDPPEKSSPIQILRSN